MRRMFNDNEEEDTGGYIAGLLNYYRGAVKNGTLQCHEPKKIMAVEDVARGVRQNYVEERATQRRGVRRRADTSPEAGSSSRAQIILTPELVDLVGNESTSQPPPREVSSFDEKEIFSPLYNNDHQQSVILPGADEDDKVEEQEEEQEQEDEEEEEQEEEEQEEELQAEERNYEGGDEQSHEQDGWGMDDRVQTGGGREEEPEETRSGVESTSETDDFERAPQEEERTEEETRRAEDIDAALSAERRRNNNQDETLRGTANVKIHVPTLCVAQQICESCAEIEDMSMRCRWCGIREFTFRHDPVIKEFVNFATRPTTYLKKIICIAHNAKSFDTQFILRYLVESGISTELRAFGLANTLDKGVFPHLFNTLDNQFYLGPLPGVEYYSPETMNTKEREQFLAWHDELTQANYIFDFQLEILRYCRNDVDILSTWVSCELRKALEKGYFVSEVSEIWQYNATRYDHGTRQDGLFAEYINTFLKLKQEASGWPSECTDDEVKERYLRDYEETEGIVLESNNIAKNSGLCSVAKLCLNSFWGKFCQQLNLTNTEIVKTQQRLASLLTSPKHKITEILPVNEDAMYVSWRLREEADVPSPLTNVVLAAYTTALARLVLYKYLERLDRRVLYYDTDSCIYVSSGDPSEYEPRTGNFLGDMTNELESYGSGSYIEAFVSGGPKFYAYVVRTPEGLTHEVCKVKGITLNFANSCLVNFNSIRELILQKEREEREKESEEEEGKSHR
nr:PREDICTED: uncharacterized protein LOC105672077 [Linepithema humile]